MNALKIISTILGALAPLMYFHGHAFSYGRLSYWGLAEDLFPQTVEQTLMQGYIAYTALALPFTFMLLIYLVVAVSTLYNVHEITKIKWIQKTISFFLTKKSVKESSDGYPAIATALSNTWRVTLLVLFLFLFLFLAIKIAEQATELGRKSAEQEQNEFVKSTSLETIMTKSESIKGHIIVCSESFCGVLSGSKVKIIPTGSIIDIEYNAPKK